MEDIKQQSSSSIFIVNQPNETNLINPDIVLIQAPGWGVNTPPLALALLSSYARQKNYTILPLDINIELYKRRGEQYNSIWNLEQSLWFWETKESIDGFVKYFDSEIEQYVEMIIQTGTLLVGFTIYNSSYYCSLEIAKRLKAKKNNIKIVFGGPHVSRDLIGLSVVKKECVDAVVQGEGELILIQLIEGIKNNIPFEQIKGVMTAKGDNVIDGGDADSIKNIDELPIPDFSDFNMLEYVTPQKMPIMSSRGCPNRCIYCAERTFWKKYRSRSAKSIFDEIKKQLSLYPFINFFDFQDSLVNGNIRVLSDLADLIIKDRELKINWSGQAVIRKEMTSQLLVKLKRSGCVGLAYGLEAPSESLMLKIGKLLSRGADINLVTDAHRQTGLGVTYNFMFGLPGETEEDAFYAQEFLRINRDSGMTVNPSAAFCFFFPGTPAYNNPDNYDINFTKGLLYWETNDGNNTYLNRLRRFEDFCRLVAELGIETTYPSTFLLDRNRSLGKYFYASNDMERAKFYFELWLNEHPKDVEIKELSEKINISKIVDDVALKNTPANYSDDNWKNGVSIGWGPAFFIDDDSAFIVSLYQVGDRVRFDNIQDERIIVNTSVSNGSIIVYLDGSLLDGNEIGFPSEHIVVKNKKEINCF